ncbi:MAG: tetratricopeptide repeat protein [bacterium]
MDRRHLFLWTLLLVGVFVAYSPTFTNGFVYDDIDLILKNPQITGHHWLDLWQDDLWAETIRGISSNYYRPLVSSSLALEYLIYGPHSLGFHIDNLLLHCITLILLFLLARDVFAKNRKLGIPAFLATAIYALHPANTQTVYWISARGDLFVTIGILLGMNCIVRKGRLATLGMAFSGFLALFSKETGVPFFLNFETGIHLFHSPTDWQFLAGIASVMLTIVLVIRFRNTRLFRWAFLFWFLSLVIFLNIFVATFESGMEHYLYLPLVALAILAAYALPLNRVSVPLFTIVLVAFAATVFARGAVWRDDVSLWSDAVSKTDVNCRQGWARSRLALARTYFRLASDGVDEDENLDRAQTLYREVADRRPEFGYAWSGLGDIALKRYDYDLAKRYFQAAVERRPQDFRVWGRLGLVSLAKRDFAGSKEACEKALALKQGYTPALITLAMVHMTEGNYAEAERIIDGVGRSGLELYPNARAIKTAVDLANGKPAGRDPAELAKTARFLDHMMLYADEARVLEALRASNAIDSDMLYRLAMINFVELRDEEKGFQLLGEGLSRFPNDLRFIRGMAIAYEKRGENNKAADLLERVLQVSPNHPDAAAIKEHVKTLRAGGSG